MKLHLLASPMNRVALLALGIRLFRTGSISYDARLDVRKVLSSRHGQG